MGLRHYTHSRGGSDLDLQENRVVQIILACDIPGIPYPFPSSISHLILNLYFDQNNEKTGLERV